MKLMEKMKAQQKKKDNKGFSLVELIIVIAIMAILVGVVGTQVIPYIENARKAKDLQQVSGFCTDAMTAYSSNASTLDASAVYRITIDSTGVAAVKVSDSSAAPELLNSFTELNSITAITDIDFESNAGEDIDTITITCQNASPMILVTVSGASMDADDINYFTVQSN